MSVLEETFTPEELASIDSQKLEVVIALNEALTLKGELDNSRIVKMLLEQAELRQRNWYDAFLHADSDAKRRECQMRLLAFKSVADDIDQIRRRIDDAITRAHVEEDFNEPTVD